MSAYIMNFSNDIKKNLNKRIKRARAAGIGMIIAFLVSGNLYVKAEPAKMLQSQGNVVIDGFGEGTITLYSSDINYLQEELNKLFAEIPE